MQGSLSNLAGVSGGTGVRVAKEGLRALSVEKPLLTPRTWLEGLTQAVPTVLACGCSLSLSSWPHYSSRTSFSEDLSFRLEFLDSGVLVPPTQKDQP